MFPEYKAHIDACKNTVIPEGTYTEKHHIVPRCLGGNDEADNLIVLTYRDHVYAHYLLAKGTLTADVDKNVKYRLLTAARMMLDMKRSEDLPEWDDIAVDVIVKMREKWSKLQSDITKLQFSDLNFRIAHSEGRKAYFKNNPEVRAKHSKKRKDYYIKHPEARIAQSVRHKEYWANNPEAKIENMKHVKAYWDNPINRSAQSERTKKYQSTPDARIANSEATKSYLIKHPEAIECFVKKMRVYWSDPEAKIAQSIKVKSRFTDPLEIKSHSQRTASYFANNPGAGNVKNANMLSSKGRLTRATNMALKANRPLSILPGYFVNDQRKAVAFLQNN